MPDGIIDSLKNFRDKIYCFFPRRQDASMELVDSLSSNTTARSIVELSLNPLHRRNYCSITRSVAEFYKGASAEEHRVQNKMVGSLLSEQCPLPEKRPFHLFAVDCTSQERLFSPNFRIGRLFIQQSQLLRVTNP